MAAHRPAWMPADPLYVPVLAGAAAGGECPAGWERDDAGEGCMSELNSRYSELTVLAWAVSNLDADSVGLAHYRRHFAGSGERGVMTEDEAIAEMRRAPVLLPKRRYYVIETVESHYGHTFDFAHIEALRGALDLEPSAYRTEFDRRMAMRSTHILNMVVMRRDLLCEWVGWLFPVLGRAEALIDFEGMTPFQARYPGRLSELLLDTWLSVNGVPYRERALAATEPVDWPAKARGFLAAKFLDRKYEASF